MKYLLATLIALLFAGAAAAASTESAATCPDISLRGHINVLTINILYSDFIGRRERLRELADFVAAQQQAGEPVDVILLQEVVSGAMVVTPSLSLNLKWMLQSRGAGYNLRQRPVTGVPGVFMVGNAMLARCQITDFASRLLPFVPERPLGGPGIPVLHEVQKIAMDVPGFGQVSAYNTHLCSFCTGDARFRQASRVAMFINNHEDSATSRIIILGGDFNTDLNRTEDVQVYSLVTYNMGFTDSYAGAHDCASCCSEAEGLAGCTYAVPGNSLAAGEQPQRIDYIFIMGDYTSFESQVVLNEAPWVSDHSGVLTRIGMGVLTSIGLQ